MDSTITATMPAIPHPGTVNASAGIPARPPTIASEDHPSWPMPLAVYEAIVKAGYFESFGRVYLWKGRLCEQMAGDRPHVHGVKRVYNTFYDLRLADYEPETEAAMALRFADSAPEPDVKVLRGRWSDYPRMPTSADVALVVEVADSTLSKDRGMAATYATEEIPIYWLLNIPDRRLEIHASPVGGIYTVVKFFGPDDEAPIVLDGREVGRVRVANLLM